RVLSMFAYKTYPVSFSAKRRNVGHFFNRFMSERYVAKLRAYNVSTYLFLPYLRNSVIIVPLGFGIRSGCLCRGILTGCASVDRTLDNNRSSNKSQDSNSRSMHTGKTGL